MGGTMKKILLVILSIITISTVIGGKYHWNQKVDAVQASVDKEKKDENRKEIKITNEEELEIEEKKETLIKLDKLNFLPKELQPIFSRVIEKNRPVHLMIAGSASTSSNDVAWPNKLKMKLLDTYGDSLIKVTIKEISKKTSQRVIEENIHEEMAELKPDILLLEPFLLYDNGEIRMAERLKNLSIIIDSFKKMNPDIMIMIQPANPIYGAYYYPNEEKDLERYSKQNEYIYLDHWAAWPDYRKKEIQDYLTKDNLPNKKGNEVWAKYLMKYFVRDGESE